MNHLYRKITLLSLLFYIGSTAYVRFDEFKSYDVVTRILFALPWDVFPLNLFESKNSISMQMGILSSREVVNLLETNLETFPHMHDGMLLSQSNIIKPQDAYLVIRFRYGGTRHHFDIKCYMACFSYSTNLSILLPNTSDTYQNIILPYPLFLEKKCEHSNEVFMRWKYFF